MPPPHQLDSCRNTSLIVYTCCSCVSHHKLAKNQGGHFVTATMHGMAYTCMTGLSLRRKCNSAVLACAPIVATAVHVWLQRCF